MSGFHTGLWDSRREFGGTLRNRKSISNEGSLTNNLRNYKASKRHYSHVFIYIHNLSILISCGTSESYIRCVTATWQGSQLLKDYLHYMPNIFPVRTFQQILQADLLLVDHRNSNERKFSTRISMSNL